MTTPSSPGWSFPWLDDAVRWLQNKRIAVDTHGLTYQAKQAVFSVPGLGDPAKLNQLKQSLAMSAGAGLDSPEAQEAAETALGTTLDKVGLGQSQWENLFRTQTHQAFVNGFDGAMQSPAVKQQFPAVKFYATRDLRTRPSHQWLGGEWRDWDGIVVLVGSLAYDLVMQALAAWGCRCMANPVDQDEVDSTGVTDMADVPQWVVEAVRTGKEPERG